MALALGALAGLLSGLQGLPKGMAEGTQADQRQQQIDLQRRQFEEGRSTDTSSIGIPGRTPNALIPYLANLAKTKEETARKATLGQGLADQILAAGTTTGMAPGASVEMPQPGALMAPPAAGPMPAMTQKTVRPEMAALAKFLPQLVQLDPSGATGLVKDRLATPKPQIVGENARGYLEGDKFTELPQPPAAPVPPGMVPKSFKQGGLTYETPGGGKSNLSQAVEDLLQANGIDPLKATPKQIDDAIAKVDARLDRRATLGATVIKPPDSGIIEKGAQQNEVITLGMDLLNRYKTNPTVKPGGMARMGEMELPGGFRPSDVIGQTQTDEQRLWVADVTALIGTYRAIKSGLAVTKSEAEYSLPIIPMNPGAVTPQQIEALVGWGRRNKTEMDRALVAANKKPLPPTSPPPTPAPPAGAPKKRMKFNPATGMLE